MSKGAYDESKALHLSEMFVHVLTKVILLGTAFYLTSDEAYLPIIFSLSLAEYWLVRNYTSKKLLGLHFWIESLESEVYFLEKVNRLYPLKRAGVFLFWYTEYLFVAGIIALQATKLSRVSVALALPLASTLAQIWGLSNAADGCRGETYKYLEDLTFYRMRRSIKC